MRFRHTLALLLSAAVLAVAVPASADPLPPLDKNALRDAIAGLPDDEASGALVQVRGVDRWRGTSGVADIHTGQPIPHHARFRIGSMTKTFTATAALQLVARGKLDLDRTVNSYVPDLLPKGYKPVTIGQLLNYTAGLPPVPIDHKDPKWFLAHRFDTWTPKQMLDLAFTDTPMLFDPGDKQHYGNITYLVLGVVIEQVTGRPYGDAIRDGIIRPLHLSATSVPGAETRIRGPHARGYEVVGEDYVDITEANPTYQWAAAEMISNAPDLDRFLTALVSGRLLPPAQTALLFDIPKVKLHDGDDKPENDKPAYLGYGLARFELGDAVFWGKTGDRPGYQGGMATTRDLARRAVFSVNTLHMGGEQSRRAQRIIAAVAGVRG